jgi:hypothetical protein
VLSVSFQSIALETGMAATVVLQEKIHLRLHDHAQIFDISIMLDVESLPVVYAQIRREVLSDDRVNTDGRLVDGAIIGGMARWRHCRYIDQTLIHCFACCSAAIWLYWSSGSQT